MSERPPARESTFGEIIDRVVDKGVVIVDEADPRSHAPVPRPSDAPDAPPGERRGSGDRRHHDR